MLNRLNQVIADRDREKGFTLVELLVVIIIIGIIAAIAIPAFLNQRTKGYDAAAKSDLKNYVTASTAYYTDAQRYPIRLSELTDGGFTRSKDVDMSVMAINDLSDSRMIGYFIMAKHKQSDVTWGLSSLSGSTPVKMAPSPNNQVLGVPGGPTWEQMGIDDSMEIETLMVLGL